MSQYLARMWRDYSLTQSSFLRAMPNRANHHPLPANAAEYGVGCSPDNQLANSWPPPTRPRCGRILKVSTTATHALHGYEAIHKKELSYRLPHLDDLIQRRDQGKLTDYVHATSKKCK